jgi:2-deoxy-D-gluconate 3-dehydrogenase
MLMEASKLFTLKGKTALVTGAARGLGREIALALAQNGAGLVLSDIDNPEDTAAAVEETGARWMAVEVDITDEDRVKTTG